MTETIGRRLPKPRAVAIAVSVTSTCAALPIEAAAVGNGWPDALDPMTVRAVLFETSVGPALMARGGLPTV